MNRLPVLLTILLFALLGCDQTTDPGTNEDFEDQAFQVELINEVGETIEVLSNEKVGDIDIREAVVLFGDSFRPPHVAERFGMDEEMLKRDQIVLHAEQEIGGELFYISMSFTFQNQSTWDEGMFYVPEISEEAIIDRFRKIWEIRREMESRRSTDKAFKTPQTNQRVVVNYAQFGFAGAGTPHVYQSLNGEIELSKVSGRNISGAFSVNLLGLPTDIYQMEELPDELNTLKLRIRGEFTANHGDYSDLKKLAADMESGIFIML